MKTIFIFIIFIAISLLFFVSCGKGCTDAKALNTDFSAEKNDGSCEYSKVGFYASEGFFSGIPIVKVDVSVDGNNIVTTNGTFYQNGPGNCSASGTIAYQFESGNSVDWNATVFLLSGATIFTSGQISPSSVHECIRVNMTR